MIDPAKRCTQATLEALGVFNKCPHYGTGLIQALEEAGHKCKLLTEIIHNNVTVRRFVREHSTGSYYLCTRGHAMALINGKLTDTAERGPDVRKIFAAFEVQ